MSDRKNILIVTFTSPYPATDGGKMSIFGTVNYLRNYFDISLVFRTFGDEELDGSNNLKKIWEDVTIHTIHYPVDVLPPERKTVKGSVRKVTKIARKMLKQLLRKDNKPKKEITDTAVYNTDRAIDFYPFQPIDNDIINLLENLFANNFYDIIQVEYSWLLNIVHILPEQSKKIFVQIENRYTILQDYFGKNNNTSLFSKYIISNARFAEISLMEKYDYIFALNDDDKKQIGQYINEDKIYVAPFPILDSSHSKSVAEYFEPQKLVFLGSQNHLPNEDAMKWFIEAIYPFVNLKLYVTGKWDKYFIDKYPAVVFTGFIDDLSELMNNSIVISPVRLGGGGIRAKVLQAMAMKCPLISTSLGCTGLQSMEDQKNIFIANTAKEFVAAINKLQADKDLCRSLITNGYNLIQKFYSEKAVGEIRKEIYFKILNISHQPQIYTEKND